VNDRIIGEIKGSQEGPLIIYVGGIHGNELQGLLALEHVFNSFDIDTTTLSGKAIAVRGNLAAIKSGKRYVSKDLNRIWNIADSLDETEVKEVEEYKALKSLIETELQIGNYSQAYLIDLHTTSAPTIPFAVTTNNSSNKDFVNLLGIPYITGLDGFLDGTMLEWMCTKGHCGLAFEAGQHHSDISMIKHEAFIRLSMYYAGFITELSADRLTTLKHQLEDELKTKHNHFVLVDRYKIAKGENFKMEPGFSNFEHVYKGEILAQNQNGNILAKTDANIFMPLYQKQGDDGFFIIKPYEGTEL